MNIEADTKLIVKTLRRVAKDLPDIGYSTATKIDVTSLLSDEVSKNGGGGVLTRCWNRESDPRRKAVLRDLIGIVVRVYTKQPNATENAAKLISGLCDRLEESKSGNNSKDGTDADLERAIAMWNSNPNITKRELEFEMLGKNFNHRSYFQTVKKYSDKQHGVGYLRAGKAGTKPKKRG